MPRTEQSIAEFSAPPAPDCISRRVWAGALVLAFGILGSTFTAWPARAEEATSLVDALERIESESGALCGISTDGLSLRDRLDTLLETLDDSNAPLRSSDFPVDRLNELIYRRLAIRASRDVQDPCNLLPSAVLERKQGYCVGIAAIYLALAERLDLPIHAVAIPSHVYLRYDDGKARIDIETLAMGAPEPEGLNDLKPAASPELRGPVSFPRDLTSDGFLAQVRNNLGVIHSVRGDHAAAVVEYRKALDLDPLLSAAWYNWGNDLRIAGHQREAIEKLDEALRLYPMDTWALNNRGRAWVALGKKSRARKDFEAALAIDPQFRPARRNLKSLDEKRAPDSETAR